MKRILDTQPHRGSTCAVGNCGKPATFSAWVTNGNWRNLCDEHAGRHLRKNMHLRSIAVEYDKADITVSVF